VTRQRLEVEGQRREKRVGREAGDLLGRGRGSLASAILDWVEGGEGPFGRGFEEKWEKREKLGLLISLTFQECMRSFDWCNT